ncbi:signal peptidase I [Schaalia cardiffensis]|uniref:signal peptidase I n=1 Tax=Schaalia cardiffensis TaxID=181487 RepID=UPI0023F3809E|nr:signal peptidase I [Schaalia cardiffensis]
MFQAVQYVALIVLGLLITLVSVIPAVMGWVPLTILSGSMAPSMPAGSLAVVAPIDVDERENIPIGTVITYMPHPDSDELVTHRVIVRNTASNGSVSYILKGDANDSPDSAPVLPKQIRAEKKYSIPFAGRMLKLLTPDVKFIGRILLASVLLVYALWQIRMSFKERSQRSKAQGLGGSASGGGVDSPEDSR